MLIEENIPFAQAKWSESKGDYEQPKDMVNKPSHYQVLPGVEVIDIRKALLAKVEPDVSYYAIDCWSRSWEYLTRMWGKNKLEDARKAKVYLEWLIAELENSK